MKTPEQGIISAAIATLANAQPRMMKSIKHYMRMRIPGVVTLVAFGLFSTLATAATVNATYNSATDVPVTASGYTATDNTVNFTLNFAPATGTDLMVVSNTALPFISGTFDNLTNGQPVALSYGGVTYRFVANYYGGSGNDLVLVWASNHAFGWGANDSGQLGDNTKTTRSMPVPVTATGVLAGRTIVAVAAGIRHSLVLCSDGHVAAMGRNDADQLGDNGVSGFQSLVPVPVNTASGVSALYGKAVVAIAAGSYYSLALLSDGTVTAWGDNSAGQLGDNTMTPRLVPVAVNTAAGVSALYGKTVVAIAAGASHSLALCSDGTVAAWGANDSGQLGDNTTTPRLVPVAVNTAAGVSALYNKSIVAIAAGSSCSFALCSDGTVAAWGYNSQGNLGDNSTTQRLVPIAVNTSSGLSALYGKTVVAIAAGAIHGLALCSDGTVATWGDNYYGQLGDNTTAERHVPVAVSRASGGSALYGKSVLAIAAGIWHSLALCSDGTVAAWGNNDAGQLGDNTTTRRYAPVAVNTTPLATGQRLAHVFSDSRANHTLALVAAPPASLITLSAVKPSNGSFQFIFTNTPGAFFSVLAAMNPALPLGNWISLTGLTEVSPGQFQFTDPQATNSPQRFYRVRSP